MYLSTPYTPEQSQRLDHRCVGCQKVYIIWCINIFDTPEQSQRLDHRWEGCQTVYVIGCMVSCIYCHSLYTWAVPAPRSQVCRASESLCHPVHGVIHIFYTPEQSQRLDHRCEGCQKVLCDLQHGVIYIFSHPIHLSSPNALITDVLFSVIHIHSHTLYTWAFPTLYHRCVGCQKVLCDLLYSVISVFSHPTHLLEQFMTLKQMCCIVSYIYILTPYTPEHSQRLYHRCVGCQKVLCDLLYSVVRVFSHPTHLLEQSQRLY